MLQRKAGEKDSLIMFLPVIYMQKIKKKANSHLLSFIVLARRQSEF